MRIFLLSLFLISSALSQTITIPLKEGFIPVSGYGIAITKEGVRLTPSSPVTLNDSGNATLSINLPNGAISYSGVIVDTLNNSVASPLKSVSKAVLPLCKVQIDQKTASGSQTALLQSLIQIRAEKRDLLKKRVTEVLDPSLLEKLNRLEEAFGLSPDIPLSAKLDPYTLSERLSLLAVVLGNLEEQKQ